MFYVAELNLKGKGPLGKMWHACHNPKKITKKIASEFSYEEGFNAIVDPADQRVWALRLNGQLLLGYVQLHGAKVRYFQDSIKQAHERLTISFRQNTASIDLPAKTPLKTPAKSITLNASPTVDPLLELSLDIPDEIPEWLRAGAEVMSQSDLLTQSSVPSSSPQISLKSFRGSDINLPDRQGSELNAASLDDDLLSDMLIPDDAKNPLEPDFASYGGYTEDTGGGDVYMSEAAGAPVDDGAQQPEFGAEDVQFGVDEQYTGADPTTAMSPQSKGQVSPVTVAKKAKKSTGKRRRFTIINDKTQLEKEEMRMWVHDREWQEAHLCRPPNPLQRERGFSDVEKAMVSGIPLAGGLGKRLRTFLAKIAVPPKEPQNCKRQRKAKQAYDEDAHNELADQNAEDVMTMERHDVGEIDFDFGAGGSSSGGGGDSLNFIGEDPEQLRAGSEDGRLSNLRHRFSRQQSESLDGESFGFEQSPMERASLNSRLTSIGAIGDGEDAFLLEGDADGTPFKDASLREEPESYQGQSQLPMSQRLTGHVTIARQIAQRLPEEDSELSFNRISKKGDYRQACRLFYSLLVLMNENIVDLDQKNSYGDITIRATANTAMYAFA